MRLRPSWTRACLNSVKASFTALYGKTLYINEDDLAKYLIDNEFSSLEAAVAHFKRALMYYKEKFTVVPRFQHLISPKIPALADIPDWEKALYASFPDFNPVLTAPNEKKLETETHGYSGLFPSVDIIELILAFAKEVAKLEEDYQRNLAMGQKKRGPYVELALVMVERLILSMAYRKWGQRADYMAAIAAQKFLARERLARKGGNLHRGVHWCAVLVEDLQTEIFNVKLAFWEMPKVYVNRDFAARLFNMPRYSNAHAKAVMTRMLEYAEGRHHLLRFLLVARDEFILTGEERDIWREESPNVFPDYPY